MVEKKKNKRNIYILVGIAAVLYLIFSLPLGKNFLNNATSPGPKGKDLVEKVAQLIEVPKDEQPTIATVSDVSKLKNQPFFARARNGDKILVYEKAGRAILYRPSTNAIVEVAPIASGQTGAGTTKEASPVVSMRGLRVAIYNGSTVLGKEDLADKVLKEKYPEVTVVTRENAARSDYKQTLVIDLRGNKKLQAENIAQLMNGKIGTLPEEELKPEADLLLIVAK